LYRSQPGKRFLVVAGAGGSMAIQIGWLLGLAVIATASRSESADWCRALCLGGGVRALELRHPGHDRAAPPLLRIQIGQTLASNAII